MLYSGLKWRRRTLTTQTTSSEHATCFLYIYLLYKIETNFCIQISIQKAKASSGSGWYTQHIVCRIVFDDFVHTQHITITTAHSSCSGSTDSTHPKAIKQIFAKSLQIYTRTVSRLWYNIHPHCHVSGSAAANHEDASRTHTPSTSISRLRKNLPLEKVLPSRGGRKQNTKQNNRFTAATPISASIDAST